MVYKYVVYVIATYQTKCIGAVASCVDFFNIALRVYTSHGDVTASNRSHRSLYRVGSSLRP
jgi:hypothetical protein